MRPVMCVAAYIQPRDRCPWPQRHGHDHLYSRWKAGGDETQHAGDRSGCFDVEMGLYFLWSGRSVARQMWEGACVVRNRSTWSVSTQQDKLVSAI